MADLFEIIDGAQPVQQNALVVQMKTLHAQGLTLMHGYGPKCAAHERKRPVGSEWQKTLRRADLAWATYENVCVLCGVDIVDGAGGKLVVVDIDVANGDGAAERIALGGDVDTLTVRTPSGGWHQ